MDGSGVAEKPLERATGAVGPRATEAFELLANETRLAILLALWDAYEPQADDRAVPFSELREQVGVRDSGQFNYHLSKLEDRFVRKVDGGYRLRRVGLLLVQSIIAGVGIEEPALESAVVDADCPACGSPTAITYEQVYVYQVCTDCEGLGFGGEHPPGALRAWTFEPTGLAGRTPEEVFATSSVKTLARIALRFEEICPECSGPVEWTLDVCEDHDPDPASACPNCGREELAVVRETCTVCKSAGFGTPGIKVVLHPAVVSFFYDRGIEVGFTGDLDFPAVIELFELVDRFEEEVASVDPLRLDIVITHEGDELRLTLDGDMNVVEVEERAGPD